MLIEPDIGKPVVFVAFRGKETTHAHSCSSQLDASINMVKSWMGRMS